MDTPTPTVNLLVLRSTNIDRARTFYQALGFQFEKHRHGNGPEHYASESCGFVFEIYPLLENHYPTSSTRVGFRVDSVDQATATLTSMGAELISSPKNSQWGRRAVLRDHEGHTIELLEPVDDADENNTSLAAAKTVFPLVDYLDTSLDELADFIRMRSKVIRPPGLNIVIIPPDIGTRRVPRLDMRNVSVKEFITYVAEMTSTSATYEDAAIVIRPLNKDIL